MGLLDTTKDTVTERVAERATNRLAAWINRHRFTAAWLTVLFIGVTFGRFRSGGCKCPREL